MSARGRRVLVGALVVVALQGAVVLGYLAVERRRGAAGPAPFAAERLSRREVAPPLEVEDASGARAPVPGSPGKVVLVHFWATWCAPCRQELPGLLALGDELARTGRFELHAVSVDDDWATIDRYFAGRVPATVVRARDPEAHRRYGASALPDSYLVDRAGRLVERFGGARDWRAAAAEQHLLLTIVGRED